MLNQGCALPCLACDLPNPTHPAPVVSGRIHFWPICLVWASSARGLGSQAGSSFPRFVSSAWHVLACVCVLETGVSPSVVHFINLLGRGLGSPLCAEPSLHLPPYCSDTGSRFSRTGCCLSPTSTGVTHTVTAHGDTSSDYVPPESSLTGAAAS